MIKIKDLKCIPCPFLPGGILYAVKQSDDFLAIKNGEITLHKKNECVDKCDKDYGIKLIEGKSTTVSYKFMALLEGRTRILQTNPTKTWEKNLKIYYNKTKDEKLVVKVHTTRGEGCILEIICATKTSNGQIQLEVKPVLWL